MSDEPGVRFGLATAAEVVALLVTGAVGLGATMSGLVLFSVTALAGLSVGIWIRAVLSVIAWAFFTGFVENRFGVLTFGDADLVRLAAFVSGTMLLTWLVLRAEVPGGTAD